MKYLRKFNESSNELLNSVKEFCDVNLLYLTDEGFDIEIEKGVLNKDAVIYFRGPGNGMFNWSDIETDFVPFLIKLNEDYKLYNRFVDFDGSAPVDSVVTMRTYDGVWTHIRIDELESFNIDKLEVICLRISDFKNK